MKYWLGGSLGAALYLAYDMKTKNGQRHLAEEQKQNDDTVYQRMKDTLEIPKLLQEREQQKLKEYKEREEVDVRELEKISKKDV